MLEHGNHIGRVNVTGTASTAAATRGRIAMTSITVTVGAAGKILHVSSNGIAIIDTARHAVALSSANAVHSVVAVGHVTHGL